MFYLVHYTKSTLPRMRICELECCSIICSELTLSSSLSVHAATKHAHGIEPTTFKYLASIQSLMIHAVKRSTARHEHHTQTTYTPCHLHVPFVSCFPTAQVCPVMSRFTFNEQPTSRAICTSALCFLFPGNSHFRKCPVFSVFPMTPHWRPSRC